MQSQDDDSRELTGNGKYAVAGLGAASSLLVPLYFVDLEIIVSNLRIAFASDFSGILLIIAYLIRFSLFVGAGIFWIWAFNRSERNAWKIFQLGIVAPAILTGADQSEQRNDLLDAARQVQQSSYYLCLLHSRTKPRAPFGIRNLRQSRAYLGGKLSKAGFL